MKKNFRMTVVGIAAVIGGIVASPSTTQAEQNCGPGGCVTFYVYQAASGGFYCWAQTCYPLTMSCCQAG